MSSTSNWGHRRLHALTFGYDSLCVPRGTHRSFCFSASPVSFNQSTAEVVHKWDSSAFFTTFHVVDDCHSKHSSLPCSAHTSSPSTRALYAHRSRHKVKKNGGHYEQRSPVAVVVFEQSLESGQHHSSQGGCRVEEPDGEPAVGVEVHVDQQVRCLCCYPRPAA